jgi:hypothetical protein
MGIFAHEERSLDAPHPAVLANSLRDSQDVSLRETAFKRGSTMPARPKTDQLQGIGRIWFALVVIAFQFAEVDPQLGRRSFSG